MSLRISDYSLDFTIKSEASQAALQLSFASRGSESGWTQSLREKLQEVLGKTPDRVPLATRWESEEECPDYVIRRFSFNSEVDCRVPGYLLLPRGAEKPLPAVVCLQGHSTGMHISLGTPKYPDDGTLIAGGRDFALQAIREGYAAFVLEQRCFGERKYEENPDLNKAGCHHAAMTALLLGRTMIGERVWDVMRGIDLLESLPEIDSSRIMCMGNSGGGTIAYYAAALDTRIAAVMPSCSVCTYRDSIVSLHHCSCNYIPGALQWFEMGDIAGLIAPRPMIVVAGRHDEQFLYRGVESCFATIRSIYRQAGAERSCALVTGEGGHRFYPELAWPMLRQLNASSGG